MFTDIVLPIGLTFLTIYLLRRRSAQKMLSKGFPLPPGPTRKPLIGNLFDVPPTRNWHRFYEWKAQYGDLVYVEVLGNRLLVVNTLEGVSDLFDSRHAIYSDRPKFTMVGELMGLENSTALLQYGEEWRRQRKFSHMALSPEAVRKYHNSVGEFVARFVDALIENPADFQRQLRLTVGRIVMSVTYGLPVDTPDDLYITDAERTLEMIGKSTVPGAFLVDLIPQLKHLPTWLPFHRIQETGAHGRAEILGLITRPYEHVKRERDQGTNQPSFTADCLDKYQSDDPSVQAGVEYTTRWAAGTMYGAGGETTYTTTLNFLLAMASHPHIQAKLKEELIRVVGTERLPTVQDRDSLPYLQAAIKEAYRWRPALPLSIARVTRTADFYKGYYIPEGTIVLPNVWAITKDDKSGFPPEEFIPERHIPGNGRETATDPYGYAFGFGRRICPGRHLGDNMVFTLISNIVATVDVSKKKDGQGMELPLTPTYAAGLVSYPQDFVVDIKPTSKAAISAVKAKVSQPA